MAAQEKKLSELCKAVKISSRYGEARKPYDQQDDWQKRAHNYLVTLRYKGRRMSLDFWMGEANTDAPDSAGVMSCLLSDSEACNMTFDEWCSELGYNEDSRKAERIYRECCKLGATLKNFLREDYETFLYAENDV